MASSRGNEAHLRAAYRLARRGLGQSWPNPSVGCILTSEDGKVVGRGYTQKGGRPHAEIMALQMAGTAAQAGTAYISLEPCCHHGKSAPCTDALIHAGIKRAVIGHLDPDSRVNGKGRAALEKAGIAVEQLDFPEAREINAGFFHRIATGYPLFILKIASSKDGRLALANKESQWITGQAARALGHRWRSECDAILTSIGTALADDPELTARLPGCPSPVRILVDRDLRLPANAKLLRTIEMAPLWIVTSRQNAEQGRKIWGERGVELISCALKEGKIDLTDMAAQLGKRGLTRILIEAGEKMNTAFLKEKLVQRLLWFQAPMLMGGDALPVFGNLLFSSLASALRLSLLEEGKAGVDSWSYYSIGA